jgi:hypothetical protein
MSTPVQADFHGEYFQAIAPRRGQYIDFTNSSEQSAAFYYENDSRSGSAAEVKGTTLISVIADQDCWIAIGSNPTAEKPASEKTVVNSIFLPAGIQEYYGVKPGWKLAVIRHTDDGSIYINEAV